MILMTGFAPFDGAGINPSCEAVKQLAEISVPDEIQIMELPVVFKKAADLLLQTVRDVRPSAVICTGLAGGRKDITPELIAVNFRNARIPDNEGNRPQWEKIVPGGPDGIFSRLPVREMVQRMQEEGIRASLSQSAGAYVCNEVMYRLLYEYDGPAGFIHVPSCTELGGEMEIAEMARALSVCIRSVTA
ncbi:MAG: pyroglutamyl-peptidase I [Lachnospiraceae bacterium]|nr:pyroglutamyl-peptidase I [Lachnospiraceae bacterium]